MSSRQYFIQQQAPYPASILGVIQKSKWGIQQMTTIVSKLEVLSQTSWLNTAVLSEREIEMLDHCQKLGEVWIGYVDGHFVCCWGLIPAILLSNQSLYLDVGLGVGPASIPSSSSLADQVRKVLRRYAST